MVKYLPGYTDKTIGQKLTCILQLNSRGGFFVQMALMDWKLKLYTTPAPPYPSTLLLQMNVPEIK